MCKRYVMTALAAMLAVSCAGEPEPPAAEPEATMPAEEPTMASTEPPPAMIVAEQGGFIPEGVEYDTAHHRFLTGSLAEGSIFEIHSDGRVTAVVEDSDLISSVGIEADEPRNRLLVANSDRAALQEGGAGQARLGIYNLTTGDRVAMVDLAAAITDPPADAMYFANDVAVGGDGTAYVTDSRMGLIYRVDGTYTASVLHQFDDFNPNGIVAHSAGYLLTGGGTMLWKVPLDDPAAAFRVTLPEAVSGQDGLVWMPDGRLAIVSNSGNRVVALRSTDDWATAELAGVAPYETQATTAAIVGEDVYVVHPHFGDEDPPSLERVTFE